jgi:hypothetical protein
MIFRAAKWPDIAADAAVDVNRPRPRARVGIDVRLFSLIIFTLLVFSVAVSAQPWPEAKAREWYQHQPWLVGANYIPATAVNELEMWQADSFDPARIDQELAWAEGIGMNTMRVFLHDLLWQQDPAGFKKRIDTFLQIAAKHKIATMFVLFDSCWDPLPQLGRQRAPKPGVHNSGWVQSPGAKALQDPGQRARLEAYVKGVVGAFAKDKRVLAWDIWNEPDETNAAQFKASEPSNKVDLVFAMLAQAFLWARSVHPEQPLTSAPYDGDWSSDSKLSPMQRLQLRQSDVISFHNYDGPAEFEKRIGWLARYQRPTLCTEYMARSRESTFQGILPIAKRDRVAAYNWGFVAGKTQTYLPWDSWSKPYDDREPAVWMHDVFRANGQPYSQEEVVLIRRLTGTAPPKP